MSLLILGLVVGFLLHIPNIDDDDEVWVEVSLMPLLIVLGDKIFVRVLTAEKL